MDQVRTLIKEIKENAKQTAVNTKDELNFMRTMLNDKEYEVDVYNNNGVVGTLNPSKAARETLAIGMSAATKIPMAEAEALADQHTFGKKEAQNYIDISKQYILGYGETGRKIKLGTRADSDVSICMEAKEAGKTKVPNRVDGKVVGTKEIDVPAYNKYKMSSPCPKYLKK